MDYFKTTLEWLIGKRKFACNLMLIERRYNGLQNPFEFISCILFKRKNDHRDNVPAYILGLAYYNFFFETFIPLCDEDRGLHGKVEIPFIPTPLDCEGYEFSKMIYDLSSTEKVCKEDVVQTFKFGDFEERNFK